MAILLNRWRHDKVANHPIVKQLQADVAMLQKRQSEIDTRQLELERMVQRILDKLETIISQNDNIVQALYASGLLNGHDRG